MIFPLFAYRKKWPKRGSNPRSAEENRFGTIPASAGLRIDFLRLHSRPRYSDANYDSRLVIDRLPSNADVGAKIRPIRACHKKGSRVPLPIRSRDAVRRTRSYAIGSGQIFIPGIDLNEGGPNFIFNLRKPVISLRASREIVTVYVR